MELPNNPFPESNSLNQNRAPRGTPAGNFTGNVSGNVALLLKNFSLINFTRMDLRRSDICGKVELAATHQRVPAGSIHSHKYNCHSLAVEIVFQAIWFGASNSTDSLIFFVWN